MAGMPGGAPCSKVELRIRCKDLLNKDVTSKSDPCVVLFVLENGRWNEEGRTENIKNSLNPQFSKVFEMDYFFEEVQKLRFAVYDVDNSTPRLDDDDFLGEMECTMGQIVSGSPYTQKLMVKAKKQAGKGTITILSEEVSGLNDVLTMKFSAQGLDKKDTFGKSDPYLEFSRTMSDGKWQVMHRTEVIKNTLNPTWKEFEVPAKTLCGVDVNKPIKVDCYDYDRDGGHDLIGSFQTTVQDLINCASNNSKLQWPAINPKKKAKKKDYKNSGIIYLNSIRVAKLYSFLDFIYGGLQINFTVGIDFTASNGDPHSPQSLHHINPNTPNEYQKAIQSVGTVIQDYDVDKMFPVLGFGARTPPNFDVSHEFPCNFNNENPFCAGVPGILQTYQTCVSQVQLYGPTNFAPIINHVARFGAAAQQEVGAKKFYILLIITDGVISDMADTLAAISQASTLPMAIIIVGVGEADFTDMNILDDDTGMLEKQGKMVPRRDIVQFVSYRDFNHAPLATLAKHVLAEVPKQVTDYYRMNGIAPNPRPQAEAPAQQ